MQKVNIMKHCDTKTMISKFVKTGSVTQCRNAGTRSVRKDFKNPTRSRYYNEGGRL